MKDSQNSITHCAHYISSYLSIPENWIYRIVIHHKKFAPIFFSRKKQNLNLFPISNLHSLDDFGRIRQYLEIFKFKLLGHFVFMKNNCKVNQVQILHVHFGYHGVKMIGLKRNLNIPMICSFYGDDAFYHPYVGSTMKKYTLLFKEASKILVLGPYMKAQLVKLGCDENKILIHHLGIDSDKIRFEKRAIKKGEKMRFLLASSFVGKKGIDIAIQALAKFKVSHEFSVDIIGDGPLKNEILEVIVRCGMEDRIKLHGYQPYSYLINLAYSCDVFIQASRTMKDNRKEGTPMSIVDAMATGMPVLSTTHSDIPEIVKDGLHGYLAEENSIVSLEACIQKLFNEPEKIEVFSVNARQWVEKEFNAKVQADRLEQCYTDVLSNRV
jgi:colanic acid/amylovoran biosynthesis glycosyltransferase